MKFALRDKNGVLKAYLTERLALKAVTQSNGHWRSAKYKTGEISQYVLEDAMALTLTRPYDEGVMIFFWRGDKIDFDTSRD